MGIIETLRHARRPPDREDVSTVAERSGAQVWGKLGSRFVNLLLGLAVVGIVPTHAQQPIGGVAAISAGSDHTCALTTGGGVKCWGSNSSGQLGDGTTTNRLTPVDVTGLTSGVAAITAGLQHTCGLTTGGGVKCWGRNGSGRLGDGTTTDRLTPVDVTGLTSGVAAVSAGTDHTCALTTSGGVKCWGMGNMGQLGDGTSGDVTTNSRLTPVDVIGLTTGGAAVSAGDLHTCALTTGGGVKCWGDGNLGQIGTGRYGAWASPVDVAGLTSGEAAVSAGTDYTCALTTGGGVKCWGANYDGQLGDGTTTNRLTPADVTGLTSGVAAVAAGKGHSCALTTGGGVKCWGSNLAGRLGDGTNTNRLTPVNVTGLTSGVAVVSAGGLHTCAVTSGGGVKCWGMGNMGQLGDGTSSSRLLPVNVVYDTSPDPFSFPPQAAVPVNSVRTSGPITPTGYQVSVPISVSNGTYSIGCTGSFASAAGTISPGQSVCARHISSNLPSTTTTTTLTIGSVSGTFRSTTASPLAFVTASDLPSGGTGSPYSGTLAASGGTPPISFEVTAGALPPGLTLSAAGEIAGTPVSTGSFGFTVKATDASGQTVSRVFSIAVDDTQPDPFGFAPASGVPLESVAISNTITPAGYVFSTPISVIEGEYSLGCNTAFTSMPGAIASGQSVCVRHVAASTLSTPVTTTLTIGGTSGTFTSITLAKAANRGDTSGDGKADLFWREVSSGTGLSWWLMNGNTVTSANYFQVGDEWRIADVGDLNGDGKVDVVWRRVYDGATYLWTLNGLSPVGYFDLGILPIETWDLVGLADFDGDGRDDLLWRNKSDGMVYGWLMNGATIASQGVVAAVDLEWTIADLADMNGDGKADIVWRRSTDGAVAFWTMNGIAPTGSGSLGNADPAVWALAGVADFNGDGKGDLLWRHTTGDTWIWLMNNGAFQSAGGIGNPGEGWSVKSLADLDGDGKTDLVWRHTDGTTYLWTMNGFAVTGYFPVSNPGGTWQIVAP